MAAPRATGHVKTVPRKRGPVYYLKTRVPGRVPEQTTTLLGPKWTRRGRPPAGYYTEKMAQDALVVYLDKARQGTLEGANLKTGHTFGDACAEHLRYCRDDKQLSGSTLSDYANVIGAQRDGDTPAHGYLLIEFGADTPLEKITTERIERLRQRLLDERKLSRRTIQKILVILHGILKRAKRKKWITTNPAENVERVRVKRSGDFNVLSPAEVMATARAAGDELYGAIIVVAAFTGLRLGELRALRWADVDFAGRAILVRRNLPVHGDEKAPKSGKVGSVPLIDHAARALDGLSRREHYTGPEDRVFTETGGALDDGAIRDEFYAALEAAGLGRLRTKEDPIVFHDLRHSFATLAVRVWPLSDVQAYCRHADISTTMQYIHHQPKTAAADDLTRVVEAAMSLDVSRDMSRTVENQAQLSDTDAAP